MNRPHSLDHFAAELMAWHAEGWSAAQMAVRLAVRGYWPPFRAMSIARWLRRQADL